MIQQVAVGQDGDVHDMVVPEHGRIIDVPHLGVGVVFTGLQALAFTAPKGNLVVEEIQLAPRQKPLLESINLC
jgi:hypothetical protein